MKKKTLALFLSAMLMVTTLVGCGGGATTPTAGPAGSVTGGGQSEEKAVTLNLSVPDPEGSYIHQAAVEYASRVSEYSGGSITINISANGSLYGGDAAAGIKQLSAGSLDMVILSTSLYCSFDPSFYMISVPYLFDDQEQLTDYLNSETGLELMNSVSSMGIDCVGRWTRSFRKVTNSLRPVNTPADLAGMVLRVPNNTLYVEFFAKCGAVCTPMNFSEVYNALQLKTLDGQENPVDVPYSNSFWEVQKYISETNHMADAWLVGINSNKMATLSENQQEAIRRAGEEVQGWNVEFMAEEDEKALQVLLDNGMEFNPIDDASRQEFVAVAQSLYPVFKGLVANDTLFDATVAFCGKG